MFEKVDGRINLPLKKLQALIESHDQSAMALKMKKASSLHIPCTDPTKQASNLQHELNKRHRKNRSVLSHVKTAVSKVVGALTILLHRKSKAGDIVTDAAKRNKQVGGISCKLSSLFSLDFMYISQKKLPAWRAGASFTEHVMLLGTLFLKERQALSMIYKIITQFNQLSVMKILVVWL